MWQLSIQWLYLECVILGTCKCGCLFGNVNKVVAYFCAKIKIKIQVASNENVNSALSIDVKYFAKTISLFRLERQSIFYSWPFESL